MSITLVVAVSQNGVIGKDNDLLWRLPNDIKRFKELTTGKVVVMGRKTWESIPEKYRPLPNRENWILTRDYNFKAPEGVRVLVNGVQTVLDEQINEDIMIIGGEKIYKAFFPYADKIEMTVVKKNYEGDAYFKAFLRPDFQKHWELSLFKPYTEDEKHEAAYSFYTLIRKGIIKSP